MCRLWPFLSICIIFQISSYKAASEISLSRTRICQLRCAAKCVLDNSQSVSHCEEQCNEEMTDNLCVNRIRDKEFCWRTCGGILNEGPEPNMPNHISWNYTSSYTLNITWTGDATLYLVEISKISDGNNAHTENIITNNTSLLNYTRTESTFCEIALLRLASVTSGGVSDFTGAYEISAPAPQIVQNLTIHSLKYINQTFNESGYFSNGTIRLVFQYAKPKYNWPLGERDVFVDLLFHMTNCEIPDLLKAVPTPEFVPGPEPRTLVAEFGADLMYRKCQFLYFVSGVQSIRCGTTKTNFDFNQNSMKSLKIDCSNVQDSPCAENPSMPHPPMCGQVEGFNYHVLSNLNNLQVLNNNITVNVTFRSTLPKTKKPLYFMAFYGDAKPFNREIDVELLGVNLYNILGNATNCPKFYSNGTCVAKLNSVNVSMVLTNLRMNKLYGVMICAIIDIQNLTFPKVNGVAIGMKSKANRIFITPPENRTSRSNLQMGIIIGIACALFFLLIATFIFIQRKQNAKLKMHQIKLQQMQQSSELRYTNLPKKRDIWELERRNLIIYDDQKLGSGAFGSVYKGRLIGIAKGNRNGQSTLGINIMRAENCDVAVKKLPEYADQLSKCEFLREISLMKTLGYHERLVNMLACITETEPYCLIVEYCSDGDLLHFLRKRCNYMMKLTEMGIDYNGPNIGEKVNFDLVITLKQLLMFAVQISYGLEYLSQKGFVHRDVAARNVLVHEKTNAKIGDFGLCRYIYRDSANYKGKGGRLPVKWMSPEAIKHYEFTTQSDVWSFGILMFEIVTLGGSPYPGIQPDDMLEHLDAGGRMEQPDNCPDSYYTVMRSCWSQDPSMRPDFGTIRQKLAEQLEDATDQYSYIKLDSQRDYYNVAHDIDVPKNSKDVRENESPSQKFETKIGELNEVFTDASSSMDEWNEKHTESDDITVI